MGKRFDRAYNMLQADKSVLSEECKSLILRDLEKKAGEYFELSGAPSLQIEQGVGTYRVTISFFAERVKQFQVLK
ncbi:MAG: hypothetical protein J6A46_03235 [Clostridia bacterium]|nr:hypothetical protein [Clostridia bacterium]